MVGAGGAAGIEGGQVAQPVALKAVEESPQRLDLVGQGGVAEVVSVLVGQGVDVGGERRHPVRRVIWWLAAVLA